MAIQIDKAMHFTLDALAQWPVVLGLHNLNFSARIILWMLIASNGKMSSCEAVSMCGMSVGCYNQNIDRLRDAGYLKRTRRGGGIGRGGGKRSSVYEIDVNRIRRDSETKPTFE